MDWSQAGAVVVSGVLIVFIALIILIGLVSLMGVFMKRAVGAKPASKAQAPAPAPAPVVQAGIEEETVAVITAAVSAYTAENGSAYRVSSITRPKELRPVWGFAGMRQNTEPF